MPVAVPFTVFSPVLSKSQPPVYQTYLFPPAFLEASWTFFPSAFLPQFTSCYRTKKTNIIIVSAGACLRVAYGFFTENVKGGSILRSQEKMKYVA
ncbi:hypothetical protein V6N11_029877 [Hibiscus sabdariffa]|uniref:Uncharacterized protein n=1 Tax=Hibiscus sabdariffa TaxID=183260 RepID=A0ABR2PJJ9_9ROSI